MVIVYPTVGRASPWTCPTLTLTVSAGISTITFVAHAASLPPVGQLLAGASVVMTLPTLRFPRSGLLIVAEPEKTTVVPTGMSPVQTTAPVVRSRVTLPDVVAASPL